MTAQDKAKLFADMFIAQRDGLTAYDGAKIGYETGYAEGAAEKAREILKFIQEDCFRRGSNLISFSALQPLLKCQPQETEGKNG